MVLPWCPIVTKNKKRLDGHLGSSPPCKLEVDIAVECNMNSNPSNSILNKWKTGQEYFTHPFLFRSVTIGRYSDTVRHGIYYVSAAFQSLSHISEKLTKH